MESNIGLLISYSLSILLMIALPVALVFFIRRYKVSWWVILAGVVTYAVSQVIHYPVLQKLSAMFSAGTLPLPAEKWLPLFNAVILGFLAALFEESARYFGFFVVRKVLPKKTNKVASAVGLGIAHGGLESIALAAWPIWPIFGGVLFQFINIVFYNPGAQIAKGVSSAQVQYALSQISQFWTIPWHFGLLPGLERIIALVMQVLLSVLVWKAIKKHNFLWFALAFFYHMLLVGIGVYLQYINWSYWAVDGIMAVFMLVNVYLIYYFWKQESDRAKLKAAGELEDDDEDDDDDDEDEEELEDAGEVDQSATSETVKSVENSTPKE
jgi:uncharacterized membrane protein YhfC